MWKDIVGIAIGFNTDRTKERTTNKILWIINWWLECRDVKEGARQAPLTPLLMEFHRLVH